METPVTETNPSRAIPFERGGTAVGTRSIEGETKNRAEAAKGFEADSQAGVGEKGAQLQRDSGECYGPSGESDGQKTEAANVFGEFGRQGAAPSFVYESWENTYSGGDAGPPKRERASDVDKTVREGTASGEWEVVLEEFKDGDARPEEGRREETVFQSIGGVEHFGYYRSAPVEIREYFKARRPQYPAVT